MKEEMKASDMILCIGFEDLFKHLVARSTVCSTSYGVKS